jgi:hypothetical protein
MVRLYRQMGVFSSKRAVSLSTFSTGARGHLACALSLSVKLSPSFRALVSDNKDSRLFAVTGATMLRGRLRLRPAALISMGSR